jgi:hypothetical protein
MKILRMNDLETHSDFVIMGLNGGCNTLSRIHSLKVRSVPEVVLQILAMSCRSRFMIKDSWSQVARSLEDGSSKSPPQ